MRRCRLYGPKTYAGLCPSADSQSGWSCRAGGSRAVRPRGAKATALTAAVCPCRILHRPADLAQIGRCVRWPALVRRGGGRGGSEGEDGAAWPFKRR